MNTLSVGRDLRSVSVHGGGAQANFGDVVDQKMEIHLHLNVTVTNGAKIGAEEHGKIAEIGRQIVAFLSPILGKGKEEIKQIEESK